uniref:Uncharacterized protein n=1 Tax=Knipowitschia caucasica TaxID=637954 RepID=A0AAV2IZX3_KNICA
MDDLVTGTRPALINSEPPSWLSRGVLTAASSPSGRPQMTEGETRASPGVRRDQCGTSARGWCGVWGARGSAGACESEARVHQRDQKIHTDQDECDSEGVVAVSI